MDDWRNQFEDSLIRYIDGEDTALSVVGIEHDIDEWSERSSRTPARAMRALAFQVFQHAYRGLELAMERCESPIEDAMLLALTLVASDRLEEGNVYYTANRYRVEADDLEYLTIEPQAEIGEYRVDFLVTLSSRVALVEFQPDAATVRRIAPYGTVDTQLVVECDGHEFHDRTRTEASRDRSRDRALQSVGFPVLRYTGSDIWRDAMGRSQCPCLGTGWAATGRPALLSFVQGVSHASADPDARSAGIAEGRLLAAAGLMRSPASALPSGAHPADGGRRAARSGQPGRAGGEPAFVCGLLDM